MKCRRGQSGFFLINILKFVLGALVTVLLLTVVWTFWGPKEAAEASTIKAFDDIILKMDLKEFNAGNPITAYGYVDKGAMIIGFDSNQARLGASKTKCYSIRYSCICACKGDNCDKVLECKAFPPDRISRFAKDGRQLRVNGGSSGKALTLKMTLSGTTVNMEELK